MRICPVLSLFKEFVVYVTFNLVKYNLYVCSILDEEI